MCCSCLGLKGAHLKTRRAHTPQLLHLEESAAVVALPEVKNDALTCGPFSRAPTDHTSIRSLPAMVSGIPLILALGTRM